MAPVRTVHRCSECGAAAPRWSGRCGGCGEWNTLVEEVETAGARQGPGGVRAGLRASGGWGAGDGLGERPVRLAEVDTSAQTPWPSQLDELDRVLGGGLVPGSVTLIGGEPGIGKSTLALQAVAGLAASGRRCLYVAAEESKEQVRTRSERLGVMGEAVWVVASTSLPEVLASMAEVRAEVCVVDSIQTMHDPVMESAPGSVSQVRQCAHELVRAAKASATAVLLIGHVTKEGALAGPRVLEHVVDTVLSFEGDRHHALRMLRAVKHRFGPTGELGLFEMTGDGLAGVADPSGLLLGDRRPGVAGCLVMPAMEGSRPLLVEIQTLLAQGTPGNPRRSAQGIDGGRLAVLLAVLDRRASLSLRDLDVYVSVVGGIKVVEPAADLAVALALGSALGERAAPADLVVLGEVGLGGEVRQVAQTQRRLAEAARLGFLRAILPASSPEPPAGMAVDRVSTIGEALEAFERIARMVPRGA